MKLVNAGGIKSWNFAYLSTPLQVAFLAMSMLLSIEIGAALSLGAQCTVVCIYS